MSKTYQVVGVGNAIVDVISRVREEFLTEHAVERGIMQLVGRDRAVELYSSMGVAREVSGGSAANTIAGLAALGVRTAYVGKVKDDQLGAIFAHDLEGPVNLTAPAPVTSKTFARTLGRVLKRPAFLPAPAFALKLALGEAADEMLLAGQRVLPTRLEASGYRFRQPDLEEALRLQVGRMRD